MFEKVGLAGEKVDKANLKKKGPGEGEEGEEGEEDHENLLNTK